MATQTSKARDRAVARTLQAAERMAAEADKAEGTDKPEEKGPRCPECGETGKKDCCWYSRRVKTSASV